MLSHLKGKPTNCATHYYGFSFCFSGRPFYFLPSILHYLYTALLNLNSVVCSDGGKFSSSREQPLLSLQDGQVLPLSQVSRLALSTFSVVPNPILPSAGHFLFCFILFRFYFEISYLFNWVGKVGRIRAMELKEISMASDLRFFLILFLDAIGEWSLF